MQVGIGKIEHGPAARRPGLQPDHLAALDQRLLLEPEALPARPSPVG
jgi:hypothetical protein